MDEQKATELITVLAGHDYSNRDILNLCKKWDVEPKTIYPRDGSRAYYNMVETIRRLSRHVAGVQVILDGEDEDT